MTKTTNYIHLNNEVITNFDYYDLYLLIMERYGLPQFNNDSMNIICNLLLLANEKTENLQNVEQIKEFIKTLG